MTLLDQFKSVPHGTQSITDWLGSGGRVAEREEAQARADICLKCPMNDTGASIATPLALGIKRMLELKNQSKLRVIGEKSLGLCGACGCVLRLQVWQEGSMVAAQLTEEEKLQLPEYCWKLQTQNQK